MANDELPGGWDVAPFAAVAKARMGPTILAKDLSSTGLPVYSAGQANAAWGFTEKKVPEFTRGTIIVSARGSIGFPKIPKEDVFTSTQTTIAVTPSPALACEYLLRFLQSTDWAQLSSGAAIPMLTISMLGELHMPVAPLAEQKRIADKLAAVLGRVDACRARLDRIPALLKRFRQSVLAAATSGKLTEEWRTTKGVSSEWEETRIRELGSVQLGRQRSPKYHNGANMRPYLRVQNVFEARLDLSDVMAMEFGESDFDRYRLAYGDILLNEGQSPQYLGRPAMFRGEIPDACFTNTLIRFQANQEVLNREYALLVFRHYMHCGRFAQEGSITTNIAHLGAGRFAEIEFMLPSLPEQQEIVRRVEELFAFADRIEARLAAAQKTVERLTPATLAKAFRGELVPQDPADEPAAAMLERLRHGNAASSTTKIRKKRSATV